VVITVLPTSAEVAEVLVDGADNLLAGLRRGSVVIDMTSGVPSTTQRLAARLVEAGVTLVDAPVSGGVARAATGDLAIMAGGPAETLARP
jgi:3-hydroxyisobutyrate dehydrogenase